MMTVNCTDDDGLAYLAVFRSPACEIETVIEVHHGQRARRIHRADQPNRRHAGALTGPGALPAQRSHITPRLTGRSMKDMERSPAQSAQGAGLRAGHHCDRCR